jgi:hypothetical protein
MQLRNCTISTSRSHRVQPNPRLERTGGQSSHSIRVSILTTFLLRKSGGLLDAPGGWLGGAKGEYPLRAPSRTDRRHRACDPVTRRRVIVDRHQ